MECLQILWSLRYGRWTREVEDTTRHRGSPGQIPRCSLGPWHPPCSGQITKSFCFSTSKYRYVAFLVIIVPVTFVSCALSYPSHYHIRSASISTQQDYRNARCHAKNRTRTEKQKAWSGDGSRVLGDGSRYGYGNGFIANHSQKRSRPPARWRGVLRCSCLAIFRGTQMEDGENINRRLCGYLQLPKK